MKVKLRILHGSLQDKAGHAKGLDVNVQGPRFVIGSAADCSMCCPSKAVSAYQCEVRIDRRGAVLRSLSDEHPTYLNDEPLDREQVLQAGDRLRIGRLEFDVLIDATVPADEVEDEGAAQEITNLLDAADERERVERLQHPELRQFHLEAAAKKPAPPPESEPAPASPADKNKKKKAPPGKLPTPPPSNEIKAEDSTDAAQQALKRMFSAR
jgi:predicted component of type VI protein secretion system